MNLSEQPMDQPVDKPIELTCGNIIPIFVTSVKKEFTSDILCSLRCTGGNTQDRENRYKMIIRDILMSLNIEYEEAHSQEPYDFRLYCGGVKHLVEIKKLDSTCSKLNDTYPSEDSHYIFLYTAKNKSHTPGVLYVRGSDFPDRDWHNKKKLMIDFLRKSSKSPSGDSSVYPRLNISLNASFFVPLLTHEGCIKNKPKASIKNKPKASIKTPSPSNIQEPFIVTAIESLLQDEAFSNHWTGDDTMLYNAISKIFN
jgi:hypothetical protein